VSQCLAGIRAIGLDERLAQGSRMCKSRRPVSDNRWNSQANVEALCRRKIEMSLVGPVL
jgi:hypothetical protein